MLLAANEAAAQTFPYPSIPATLRTPQERGAYLLEHYWDRYNFADTALTAKENVAEQGFVNFIDLIPRMDSVAAVRGIDAFAGKAFNKGAEKKVSGYFASLAEHYLYDPNSPMRNDNLYMLFLAPMSTSEAFTATERNRYMFQKKNLEKNNVGDTATDFAYVDRGGRRNTLHSTEGEYTLIYFNDPDCENCHAITKLFAADSLLADNPRLTVLALYPDSDTDEWRRKKQPFPPTWIDAYSPNGEVGARQLYFIRATPTIYLLDKDKKVVLKDPPSRMAIDFLRNLFNEK